MDRLKQLLSSTKGKIFLGVGVVVVLVFVFMRKRSGAGGSSGGDGGDYSSYNGGSGGGGSSTPESGISQTEFLTAIEGVKQDSLLQMQEMQNDMEARTNLLNSNFEASFNEMSSAYSNQLQEQTNAFTNTISGMQTGFQNQLTEMDSQHDAEMGMLTETMGSWQQGILNSLTKNANQNMSNSAVLPVVVDYNDRTVYSAENQYASAGGVALQNAQPVYGYGGANYNTSTTEQKKQLDEHEKRLSADEQYKQSEIERTKNVIAQRQKDGLSTKEQEKYLNVNLGQKGA